MKQCALCALIGGTWSLNFVYITSKNSARHIKKPFQKRSFSQVQSGGGIGKTRKKTSIISLTTMSFEMALAITNQKTIKDENKDKLNVLCFMVKATENESKPCVYCSQFSYMYICVFHGQRSSSACVGICLYTHLCVRVCVCCELAETC